MYSVYVLKSEKDGKLYIGCTANIEKRIQYHDNGKVFSTKSRRPFKLIYKEEYSDKCLAFKKEKYYKTAKGKKEIKNKIKHCGVV